MEDKLKKYISSYTLFKYRNREICINDILKTLKYQRDYHKKYINTLPSWFGHDDPDVVKAKLKISIYEGVSDFLSDGNTKRFISRNNYGINKAENEIYYEDKNGNLVEYYNIICPTCSNDASKMDNEFNTLWCSCGERFYKATWIEKKEIPKKEICVDNIIEVLKSQIGYNQSYVDSIPKWRRNTDDVIAAKLKIVIYRDIYNLLSDGDRIGFINHVDYSPFMK